MLGYYRKVAAANIFGFVNDSQGTLLLAAIFVEKTRPLCSNFQVGLFPVHDCRSASGHGGVNSRLDILACDAQTTMILCSHELLMLSCLRSCSHVSINLQSYSVIVSFQNATTGFYQPISRHCLCVIAAHSMHSRSLRHREEEYPGSKSRPPC